LSGTEDFVRRHPAGFGAQVGEQGRNLSGGQRQAVGLARALVRDPDILILDEPTSNMDVETERMVQARLASIAAEKTLILITHRLSMLRMVDRVIVMDSGKIVMDGPRDAVLSALQQRRHTPSAMPATAKAAPAKPGPAIQVSQARPAKAAETAVKEA
ncbi:MAG: ATP-binding cassette domain-containing protein, partial [Mailhella sp.]|nr:ATP-binding cassette domain-containing protein [Mailhella sp.]